MQYCQEYKIVFWGGLHVTNPPIRWTFLTSVWPPLPQSRNLILDSNLKTLQPINLKMNSVVGHHLGQVSYKIGAIWKNKMADMSVNLKYCFLYLKEASAYRFQISLSGCLIPVSSFWQRRYCPQFYSPTSYLPVVHFRGVFLYWTAEERPELCTCSV